MQALWLVLSTSSIHGGRGWSCNIHSMVLLTKTSSHCADLLTCFKYLSHPWGEGVELSYSLHGASWCFQPRYVLTVQALWLVLSTSPIHRGAGGSCNIHSMVLLTKTSSHCADLLTCFKYLSHPWGEGVELSYSLHGASWCFQRR